MIAQDDLVQTAREESSHCVLHWLFSHFVKEVVLDGNDSYCRHWVPDDASNGFALELVVTACAGRCFKATHQEWLASKDYRLAYERAALIRGNDAIAVNRLLKWGEHVATVLLEGNHEQVEKLSCALAERGRLSGEEIKQILNGRNGA